MSIGSRIKNKRKALKLTQQELSKALSITPQHISALEQDKRQPSISMLEKLAVELGVTIDYLITGKETVLTWLLPAIKADKKLSLKARKALACLVEELYEQVPPAEKIAIRRVASVKPIAEKDGARAPG